jgi:capsular polysaccharide biosynthesis protein
MENLYRVVPAHKLLILTVIISALVGAGVVTTVMPARYTANMTMYISAATSYNADVAFQGSLLAQERTRQYVQLVRSLRVSEAVVQQLGLSETAEEVATKINASTALESVLLEVSVTDSAPVEAARIANGIGDVFPLLAANIERRPIGNQIPTINVEVLDRASVPTAPSTNGLLTNLVLGGVAGLVLGIGAVFLMHVGHRRRTSQKDEPEEFRTAMSGEPIRSKRADLDRSVSRQAASDKAATNQMLSEISAQPTLNRTNQGAGGGDAQPPVRIAADYDSLPRDVK